MSMVIIYDTKVSDFLASNMGWSDVSDWVKSIPVRLFPNLTSLIYHGQADNLPKLRFEIEQAVKRYPIRTPSVEKTVKFLLKSVRENERSAQLAIVTNGIIPAKFQKNKR